MVIECLNTGENRVEMEKHSPLVDDWSTSSKGQEKFKIYMRIVIGKSI